MEKNDETYIIMKKRIDDLLKTGEFEFSGDFLKAIHKYLFRDILENSGEFRSVNLTRKEEILDGKSVSYSNYFNIERYLNYDMERENLKKYDVLTREELIDKLVLLNYKLWLTHPFKDGNTRTISVFMRLLLAKLGYSFDNELFRLNFDYYRGALVRASFETGDERVDNSYLKLFFWKILFDKTIELNQKDLYYSKKKIRVNN